MATNTASARRARHNRITRTVRVYDMETGALLRVTTTRGEIARRLSVVDTAVANGEMGKREHAHIVRRLTAMLSASQDRDDTRDDETVATRADRLRAHRDYDGVWSDEMRSAFGL